ncbi:MAG: RAMP superfamily CRISPR-associated protein [Nitrososphaeria archaeon]|uniref:RAMP superfamily CRISPR-associated protein n=1 Tax=Saccharolobus sp. TaxID=2100761 RepID=UPI003175BA74
MDFNVDIKIRFTTIKKLNVGSAYAIKTQAEVPIQKILLNDKQHVFIPASTIKGVLRTSLMKVANLLGYKVAHFVDPERLSSIDGDIVVNLFGGPHNKPSKVFVDPVIADVQTITLKHITIDDKIGVVKERALFSVEYIPLETRFETFIYGRGLTLEEVRALFTAILELNYERIGKCGLIDVKIIKSESKIQKELLEDEIIKNIWEGIGI